MFLRKSKPKNYEDRPKGTLPDMIILHYTGMETMLAARERLCDPDSKVSAHYLVDEDGAVYDLVAEDKRAWHAGVSYWKGDTDINSRSIGIEIVNPGHDLGYRPFTGDQMRAVLDLCRGIMQRHEIEYVLGHSDVALERKKDPGELFDWEWLAGYGVGIWPKPVESDFEKAQEIVRNEYQIERLLTQFGYNPLAAYIDVVTAFHRHFSPEKFYKSGNIEDMDNIEGETAQYEQMDLDSVARLVSLLRQSSNKLEDSSV